MPELISLTCPSCGGKLQTTDDIDRFACANCGNEHIVQREHGIITLKPVIEEVKGVRRGVDKTASELALVRLRSELEELHSQKQTLASKLQYLILGIVFALISVISIVAVIQDFSVTFFVLLIFSMIITASLLFLFIRDRNGKKGKLDKIARLMSKKEKEYLEHLKIVRR